jgi:hypothetical protein
LFLIGHLFSGWSHSGYKFPEKMKMQIINLPSITGHNKPQGRSKFSDLVEREQKEAVRVSYSYW